MKVETKNKQGGSKMNKLIVVLVIGLVVGICSLSMAAEEEFAGGGGGIGPLPILTGLNEELMSSIALIMQKTDKAGRTHAYIGMIPVDETQTDPSTIIPTLNSDTIENLGALNFKKKEIFSIFSEGVVDLTVVPLVKQLAAPDDGEPRDREVITVYELDMLSHNLAKEGYRDPAGLGLAYLLSDAEEGFDVQAGITHAEWVTLVAVDSALPSGDIGVVLRTQEGELIEMPREEFESRSGLVTEIQNNDGEIERVIVTDVSVSSKWHFLGIGAYVEYVDSSGQVNKVSPQRFLGLWNGGICAPDPDATLLQIIERLRDFIPDPAKNM